MAFGKGKNKKEKKKKKTENFDMVMDKSLYKTMFDTLMDISTMEYKKETADGKQVVDHEMTVRMIRQRAKLSLGFVETLKRKAGEEK